MKEIINKIKYERIYNKLFNHIEKKEYGYYYSYINNSLNNSKRVLVFESYGENIITYKYIEDILGITYNRNIHDIVVDFVGTECLLFHVDIMNDVKYITIDEYERISTKN